MATIPVIKNIFNAGELSPKVYTRSDIDKFKSGCKTLKNFVPLPHGGVQRRPGFEYIASAKANNAAVRLIPFQFSTDQAYIIEAGNGYFRFFKDGAAITLNNNTYELNTTFTANELNTLQYAQSYDTLFITHKNHHPKIVTRTAHNNWTIGNISFNNASATWGNNGNGYPRTCCFYQDRLCFASSAGFPSRMWLSNVGSYYNMTTGVNDSDGMVLNLLSSTSDAVFWLNSGKSLLVGADSGVWMVLAASGSTSALSPTNKKADKISYFGTAEVMPAKLGDMVIHSGFPATKVRELDYDFQADGYKSKELSVLSDHLFEGKQIVQMAYQQAPFEIVWCLMNDGTLNALTYMKEHQVIAWSQHTSGTVRSIATIPGTYETELWAAIDRSVNNNTVTYIERLRPFASTSFNNSFFVDSGKVVSNNNAATSITGLDHLEGEVVSYLADGKVGTATVSSGAITVSPAASYVIAGIAYTSDVETMPVAPELKYGDSTFLAKRITEIAVRCRNSAGGSYGPSSSYLAPMFNNSMFTDGHVVNLSRREGSASAATEKTVFIRQTDPLPMSIDCIGMEVEVE